MADVKEAIDFTVRQEDSGFTGAIVALPGDRGGRTRFGLAERFHPDLVRSGYYDLDEAGEPTVLHDAALAIAEQVYADEYAAKLCLDGIESQEIANRLLSFAVNEGPHEAVVLAQRACQALACAIVDDGLMGPATVAAVNSLDPDKWVRANRALQEAFYRHLVATQPNLMPYLHGLLGRADA